KHKHINQFFGYLMNFLGGFHTNWKIQHNVLHHSFTNVHGFDEDLENGIMRFSPNQDYKKRYKLQAFYAWFFYGLMTLYWLIAKDFRDLIRYKNAGILKEQKIYFPSAMAKLVFNKLWYVGLLIALPIAIVPISPLLIIGGFILMHFICGLILALIFQPAHVLEETEFFEREENGSMENNWAIHQLKTTANFAKGSRLFSWLIGGLNFQIEHHLFPNICHVHYRKISKIVKKTAEEFNLPYHEHVTFYSALKSHFSLLHQLGKAPVAA
ncbi:MAG TPA: acyl-CoA desaturase, partial [Bacteroidetes bacterium]|nr:acyl-CoA desaturase [Bacteroidota bacterium]